MTTRYDVYIDDALGNRVLPDPVNFSVLDYTRAENNTGPLTLTLPGDFDGDLFKRDGLIEVWRSVEGGLPYLDTETVWLIRRKRWQKAARQDPTWTLYAFDLNHLLKRRIVDYNPGNTTYTALLAAADNIGKTIVSQNFRGGATDATRSIASYLALEGSYALAPVVSKAFARQYVDDVLRDLAQWSYQQGTYLVFDIVCSVPPASGGTLQFEFRSYTGQRGIDHRFPSGNPPLLIGPDFNNLDNVDDDDDATDEATRGIATGQGVESIQAVARANDTARQGASPFNLIERVRNAANTPDAAGLADEAEAELREGAPKHTLSGKIVNTSGLLYGLDWKWGDLFTGQARGSSFDCHIDRVHVHVERERGEQIDGFLRGAVA